MPEVVLRDGLDPNEPDRVVLAVVVDPEGSPGEWAVAKIGQFCYLDEEDEVAYIASRGG
ncbi:hypothetical protein ACFOWZ_05795 [Lentzea rhizosphaerae]|uniref:Uncharacterized protein n=1 Tax=Lentzea rhizosphaerae TaxID=2041025 RepID=A0ABV8BM27_9PSEU